MSPSKSAILFLCFLFSCHFICLVSGKGQDDEVQEDVEEVKQKTKLSRASVLSRRVRPQPPPQLLSNKGTRGSALKIREDQVTISLRGVEAREDVLGAREEALDVRDADLDQRTRDLDAKVLDNDKRLKEREARLAQREAKLTLKEQEVLQRAEDREQAIDRLSRERESAAGEREKALIQRENAVAERERALGLAVPRGGKKKSGSQTRVGSSGGSRLRGTPTPRTVEEDAPPPQHQEGQYLRQRIVGRVRQPSRREEDEEEHVRASSSTLTTEKVKRGRQRKQSNKSTTLAPLEDE